MSQDLNSIKNLALSGDFDGFEESLDALTDLELAKLAEWDSDSPSVERSTKVDLPTSAPTGKRNAYIANRSAGVLVLGPGIRAHLTTDV